LSYYRKILFTHSGGKNSRGVNVNDSAPFWRQLQEELPELCLSKSTNHFSEQLSLFAVLFQIWFEVSQLKFISPRSTRA